MDRVTGVFGVSLSEVGGSRRKLFGWPSFGKRDKAKQL